MKVKLFLLLTLLLPFTLLAQDKTQTITGRVIDKITQQPIMGAAVIVERYNELGASTDENGHFSIENVPIGRQVVRCQYLGFETYVSEGLVVSSTKGIYLEIELTENSIDVEEVVVLAGGNVNKPINELSVVSTRSFTADETERIPASYNDLNRMAMSYPGVTNSNWDVRNEIVIRGNAPFGMSWRLEGIDIPNPNHYFRPGTSGGGTSIFSAQLLSRSDFSTGGMPAEYGNALSGTMDVHFRKGNMHHRQHRFRLGLVGLDFATEGPIQEGKSSYLVNYRYSALGLLSKMGFHLVGERVENVFQDLSFNIAFDGDAKNKFTIFGLGGLSEQNNYPIDDWTQRDPIRISHWRHYTHIANSGTIGGTYTRLIDDKSYLKIGVALIGQEATFNRDFFDTLNIVTNYHDEGHIETRLTSSITYSRKFDKNTRLKTGIYTNNILNYNFHYTTSPRENVIDILTENRATAVNGQGTMSYYQFYAQVIKKLTPQLQANIGFHSMFLTLNNTASFEPRASLSYQINRQHSVRFAYGLYSKMIPKASYFYTTSDTVGTTITTIPIAIGIPNQDLPFLKTHHFIGSYQFFTQKGLRVTAEAYYQHLFNIPIGIEPTDFFWLLNFEHGFVLQDVSTNGTGQNYGLDLSIEKFFANRVFFLLTGSLYKSYFTPSDGQRYHSNYSGNFTSNLTIGREFNFKNGSVLQLGARIIYNGGYRYRYSPLDEAASLAAGAFVPDYTQYNTLQMPNFFRMDSRIAYRFNKDNLAGRISLDIHNLLNYRNVSTVGYSEETNELILNRHHGGLTPVLAFTFDF